MILETMLKRHSLVTIPFSDVKRLYETSTEDSETYTKAVHASDDGGNRVANGDQRASSKPMDSGDTVVGTGVAGDSSDGSTDWTSGDEDEDSDAEGHGMDKGNLMGTGGVESPVRHRVGRLSRQQRVVAAAVQEVPTHLNDTRRRQWKQDAQRSSDTKRMQELCTELLAARRLPKPVQAAPSTRSTKPHSSRKAKNGRTSRHSSLLRHEARERQQRPSSAQSYLIVRKQAHERRVGAWAS
jgi:hypothetical protein